MHANQLTTDHCIDDVRPCEEAMNTFHILSKFSYLNRKLSADGREARYGVARPEYKKRYMDMADLAIHIFNLPLVVEWEESVGLQGMELAVVIKYTGK